MFDLITIGDITVDLYMKGHDLSEVDNHFKLSIGGKYVVDFFHESIGGGAANVAIASASYGLNTASCATVGENAFKHIILQGLVRKSVSTELIVFEKDFMNISTILLSHKGEKSVIHYPGVVPQGMNKLTSQLDGPRTKALYLGNLITLSRKEKLDIMKSFKQAGSMIFLNLGTQDTSQKIENNKELLSFADVLIFNTHEYCELINERYESVNFAEDCTKKIGFEDKLLVLTDADKGSYAYYKGQIYKEKGAAIIKIVDSTGAGDAYAGSFIALYLQGNSIQACMHAATEHAGRILQKIGAN